MGFYERNKNMSLQEMGLKKGSFFLKTKIQVINYVVSIKIKFLKNKENKLNLYLHEIFQFLMRSQNKFDKTCRKDKNKKF